MNCIRKQILNHWLVHEAVFSIAKLISFHSVALLVNEIDASLVSMTYTTSLAALVSLLYWWSDSPTLVNPFL